MKLLINHLHKNVIIYISLIVFVLGFIFIINNKSSFISRNIIDGFDLADVEKNIEGGIEKSMERSWKGFESLRGRLTFDKVPHHCPNLLIKKDDHYYLYNSKKSNVPGINPIRFNHLEEYQEFIQWLRGQGIRCPVLHLQQTYDTQGERTYRVTHVPDPDDPNQMITGMIPSVPEQVSTEDLLHVRESSLPLSSSSVTKLYDAGHDKGSMPAFDPHGQYIGLNTPLDQMEHIEERTQVLSDNPMDANFGGAEYARQQVAKGVYKDDEVKIYIP